MELLKARLVSKTTMSKRALYLTFKLDKIINYKPGQFLTFFLEKDGKKFPRSYSLSTPSIGLDEVSFGIKLIDDGVASEIFKLAQINDEFVLRGPFGEFIFDENDSNEKTIFVATDTGVMPFYAILQAHKVIKPTQLIFGCRDEDEIYCRGFFEKLQDENDLFTFSPTLTRQEWSGLKGRVQDQLPKDCSDTTFYICGRKEMVIETIKILEKKGVSKENIKFERYN